MELEAGRVKAARHASARTPAQVVFLPSGMQPCDCHALQNILSEEWCCEEVAHLFRQDRSCADYKTDYIPLLSLQESQVDGVHEGAQIVETGTQVWKRHELEPGEEEAGAHERLE
jgi:hypothetical protein